jgi:hypothetical protein
MGKKSPAAEAWCRRLTASASFKSATFVWNILQESEYFMEYKEKPFLTLQCDTACFYVEYPGICRFISET